MERTHSELDRESRLPDISNDTKALTTDDARSADEVVYEYEDSRKLGITSSVFLILNKMIGTGSTDAIPWLVWNCI